MNLGSLVTFRPPRIAMSFVLVAIAAHFVLALPRHPALPALALATGSMPFYAAVTGLSLILDRMFCPYEEQKALAEFGDRYVAYRRTVRRWI